MSLTQEPYAVVLEQLLDPIGRCLTPEVARRLVELRADPTVQARLDTLADKNTEGALTTDERAEYEAYVRALDFIAVLQAKARRLLADANGG